MLSENTSGQSLVRKTIPAVSPNWKNIVNEFRNEAEAEEEAEEKAEEEEAEETEEEAAQEAEKLAEEVPDEATIGATTTTTNASLYSTSEAELALVHKWRASCPPFATAEHDAVSLAVLLMWAFPEACGATAPLSTARWEELLAMLRRNEGEDSPAIVRSLLEVHAPQERVDRVVGRMRQLL